MAWYEISLDELYYNEDLKQKKVTEPRQKAVKLCEMMISRVLEQLGVDTSLSDEEIREQQLLMDISVREMDEQQLKFVCWMTKKTFNANALGFYVEQYNQPVAFISDPYLKNGKIVISIESYNFKVGFNETSMKLVGNG